MNDKTKEELAELVRAQTKVIDGLTLELAARQPLADSFVAPGVAMELTPLFAEKLDRIARSYFSESYGQEQVKHAIHDAFIEFRASQPVAGELPPLPERTETPESGDLVGWLRTYAADSSYSHNDYADVMRHAAEEIERLTAQPVQQPAAVEATPLAFMTQHAVEALRAARPVTGDHSIVQRAPWTVPIYTAPVPAAGAEFDREEFIEQVIQSVAELPDRDSPEDQPDMMLVTSVELRGIIESQFEIVDEGESVPAAGVQGDAIKCKGENCTAVNGIGHSQECQDEHTAVVGDFDSNNEPEARYAGYKGHALPKGATDAQKHAYEVGKQAAIPKPDSGRDAALGVAVLRDSLQAARHAFARILGNVEAGTVHRICTEQMQSIHGDLAKALLLAAHPAPSSEAALVQVLTQVFVNTKEKKIREYVKAALAAHPANGAQAGLSELQKALDDAKLGQGSYHTNYDGNKLGAAVEAILAAAKKGQ